MKQFLHYICFAKEDFKGCYQNFNQGSQNKSMVRFLTKPPLTFLPTTPVWHFSDEKITQRNAADTFPHLGKKHVNFVTSLKQSLTFSCSTGPKLSGCWSVDLP